MNRQEAIMARHLPVKKFFQVIATVIALASLCGNYDAMAQDSPVRIAISDRATSTSLGWIGTETGIFKQLGLNIIFSTTQAGPKVAELLFRGDSDFAEGAGSRFIEGVLDGAHDTVFLLSAYPAGAGLLFLVARGDITQLGQLANARIGVTRETGREGVMVRAILQKQGITATLVPLGTFPKIYAAVGAREIDAAVLPSEYRLVGQRALRLNTLADLGAEFGFQPAVLSTTRRLIGSNRALVARVVEGYVRAIHLFKTDRSVVLPLLRRYVQTFDQQATEDIYAYYADRFQKLPLPSPKEIQSVLSEFAAKYPAARNLSATAFTDTSFLEEIERSGLLARLYGAKRE
jgi:ABC-type nitrate/sulfonate/bicarbonate transport system substrate-binding protein